MRKLLVFVAFAGFGLPAIAEVSPAEIATFLKEETLLATYDYRERSTIYRTLEKAPAAKRRGSAAATLAAAWHIPEGVAGDLIDAIVLSEGGGFGPEYEKRIARAVDLFGNVLIAVPQSPEAWALGIHFWSNQGHCDDIKLRDDYLQKPFAASHYLELDSCENWLTTFVKLNPDKLAARFALVKYLVDRNPRDALAASRWLLDAFPARHGSLPGAEESTARLQYFNLLGRTGLSSILLEEGAALAPAELDIYLHGNPGSIGVIDGHEIRSVADAKGLPVEARRQWVLALVAAGRIAEARSLTSADKDLASYLRDILRGPGGSDLYDRYVGDGDKGLLWSLYQEGKTAMLLAANFLESNKMESAGEMLRGQACAASYERGEEGTDAAQLRALPPEFQRYAAHFGRLLSDSAGEPNCGAQLTASKISSQLPHYNERALSDAQKASAAIPDYSGKVPLPASFELVRAEASGQQILAICISPVLDPGGEVSRGGYWLLRSMDGGAHWLDPNYLGFQNQSPYVVSPEARVSMFAPEVLRLEVEVSELDPDSITFPPVGLRARREAKDLYIDIPYSDLTRDSDGDGFTDIVEAKLATDPNNRDTDGDGLSDKLDDFPQASARATPDPLAPIIVDLLKQVVGYERSGIIEPLRRAKSDDELARFAGLRAAGAGSELIVFLEGDAKKFAGLRTGGQVIVLNAAQIADIEAHFGPFYPLSFSTILVDPARTRALVRWGAGWTGGTITYKLLNGRWIGKRGERWITRRETVTSRAEPRTSPG